MNWQDSNALIKKRDFEELFLGNHGFDAVPEGMRGIPLSIAPEKQFTARAICQKRGFVVSVCEDEGVFDLTKQERKKLLRELGRAHVEHLLILCGKDGSGKEQQRWMVTIRPKNEPFRYVEVDWHESKATQLLQEKLEGIVFPFAEEGNLTISTVVERVRKTFMANSEEVTARFYDRYKNELDAFCGFIKGIEDIVSRREYAALMINRLMFIYFIQKKRFLDGDIDYLQNRLRRVQQQYGKDKFHNKFYREFLKRLFREGLDTPLKKRNKEINELLGKVPYLNGGLFDEHKLECDTAEINIADEAFEKLFAFFERYRWHLDSRSQVASDEINPDVLGYIFEKYINDRAKMGAYYTKEDITEYISKNTILPYLLRQAKEGCQNAFNANTGIWRYLRENPDKYIYDSMQWGCDISDKEIQASNIPREHFLLPKEQKIELFARRRRYFALRDKMSNGEINRIEDLVTYNLDIVLFIKDALDYEGSDFISVFFCAIAGVRHTWGVGKPQTTKRGMSILDPSCGSGAFLFAALKILQPLYKICVERMREFVKEDDHRIVSAKNGKKPMEKYPLFRKVLAEIDTHPNQEYWIYKTIILENLYGVDKMVEATEIAKLRLFLQLAAVAEYDESNPNLGLEPLPDIDYNIRAGNSLVGFSSMKQFEGEVKATLSLDKKDLDRVRSQAETVKLAYDAYKQAQEEGGEIYVACKHELGKKLGVMNDNLNQYMARASYGIGIDNAKKYNGWKNTHQPFHWFAEFYGIIEEKGGFDVIIGNPPYVSRNIGYAFSGYQNNTPPDLYAIFLERVESILNDNGGTGMIVPLNLGFRGDFSFYRKFLFDSYAVNWFSFYDKRPIGLFADVQVRNTIHIGSKRGEGQSASYSARLHRFSAKQRITVFDVLEYAAFTPAIWNMKIPKIGTSGLMNAFECCLQQFGQLSDAVQSSRNTGHELLYKGTGYNWLTCAAEMPPCYRDEQEVPDKYSKGINFSDQKNRDIAMLLLEGKLGFIFWLAMGDAFHVTKDNLVNFPVSLGNISKENSAKLLEIHGELSGYLPETTQYMLMNGIQVGNYNLAKCRHITDKSDAIFSELLGFQQVWDEVELYYTQTVTTEENDDE